MIIEEIKRRVANGDDLETASGAVLDIMQAAAAEERAKIVAWLRAQNRLASLDLEQILANDIEAGEHLK